MSYLIPYVNGVAIPTLTLSWSEQYQLYTSSAKIVAMYPVGGPFPNQFDPVVIYDEAGTALFGGYVSVVQLDDKQIRNATTIQVSITVRNYRILTDAAILTKDYTVQTDIAIIQDAFTTSGLTDITVNPANLTNIISLSASFNYNTLSEVMDQITQATGGAWYIDATKNLHYVNPITASNPAPFGLSDTPDGTNTFPFYGTSTYAGTFSTPINDLTLLGGIGKNGAPIVVTSQNAASIATYGRHFYGVVKNNELTDVGQAQAVADAYVKANGIPKKTLTLTIYKHGLKVGQVVKYSHAVYGFVNVDMIVQSITTTLNYQTSPFQVSHVVSLGDYAPSFLNTFRKATSIVNPVFNPVIPYDPQSLATATMTMAINGLTLTGGSGSPVYTGNAVGTPVTILNLTNTAGKLFNIQLVAQQELYPAEDGGPGSAGPRPYNVWIDINLDGQGAQRFLYINSSTSTWVGSGSYTTIATRTMFDRTLAGLLTPGPGNTITVTPLQGISGIFQLEFVNSCLITMGWTCTGLTTPAAGGHLASIDNNPGHGPPPDGQFSASVFWGQKYPA